MTELLGLPPALTAAPAVRAAFTPYATLGAALAVQAALARALAAAGLCTRAQAEAIVGACDPARYDLAGLAVEAARAGTLAIPLVRRLTAEVAKTDAEAASFVHRGATSQDVLDTSLVLQLRAALGVVRADLDGLTGALRALARQHRGTLMTGRTLLQPGPPITLGLKAAQWLGGVARGVARLDKATEEALVLQFGGAVGTLAALDQAAPAVAQGLARALGLKLPPAPWHAQRDRLAALACAVAVLTGSVAKVARDISLLMQAEVAEAAEPQGGGRGGSSAMPHKRNPMACTVALAAAHRAPGLAASVLAGLPGEHERAAGAWQAEAAPIAELVLALSAATAAVTEAVAGLQVDAARMRTNWDALHGLPLAERLAAALAPTLGRAEAHALAERLCAAAVAGGHTLAQAAAADPAVAARLDDAALQKLMDPATYLGQAMAFTDALMAEHPP
jgi:3-carboxy-cis,cis-muconate cycloisomerase